MRNLLKYAFILSVLALAASCVKPDPDMFQEYLDVTPNNIRGKWQMISWSGQALPEGTYFYMELLRKDKEYTIYENLADPSPDTPETGRYNISLDPNLGAVIRGMKDYSYGSEWTFQYVVTDLTEDMMTWTVVGNPEDVSVFKRIGEFPALEE